MLIFKADVPVFKGDVLKASGDKFDYLSAKQSAHIAYISGLIV
jgi:hypothetical protein